MTDIGWKMSGNKTEIYLSNGATTIHFNIPIPIRPIPNQWILTIQMSPINPLTLTTLNKMELS